MSTGSERIRVVAGIVVRHGELLVAKRGEEMSNSGKWEFPGGKVELGESDEAAIVRELYEELNITVRPRAVLGEALDVQSRPEIHLIGILCSLESGVPRAMEHSEVRWMNPVDFGELDLCRSDIELLKTVVGVLSTAESSFLGPL